MRIALLVAAIVGLFALPFFIVGERYEELLDGARAVAFLRAQGGWAALIGVGAIAADLVVPVPAQAIMTALGLLFGFVAGGLLATLGNFLAGCVAYWACRLVGRRAARFIAGERDMARLHSFFERHGFWAIALSRWVPVVPEVLSCLAGVTRMSQARFALSTFVGSASVGFAYAALGASEVASPAVAIGAAVAVPVLLLPLFYFAVRRSANS